MHGKHTSTKKKTTYITNLPSKLMVPMKIKTLMVEQCKADREQFIVKKKIKIITDVKTC